MSCNQKSLPIARRRAGSRLRLATLTVGVAATLTTASLPALAEPAPPTGVASGTAASADANAPSALSAAFKAQNKLPVMLAATAAPIAAAVAAPVVDLPVPVGPAPKELAGLPSEQQADESQVTLSAAMAAARQRNHRVAIEESSTGHSENFANPDGTITTLTLPAGAFHRENGQRVRTDLTPVSSLDLNYAASFPHASEPLKLGARSDNAVSWQLPGGTVTASFDGTALPNTGALGDGSTSYVQADGNVLKVAPTLMGWESGLVISHRNTATSFSMTLHDPNHVLAGVGSQQPDGTWKFPAATGDASIVIPAPTVYEATGGPAAVLATHHMPQSTAATLVVNTVDGGYRVTAAADPQWVANHALPIVVDPGFYYNTGEAGYYYGAPITDCAVDTTNLTTSICQQGTIPDWAGGGVTASGSRTRPLYWAYDYDLFSNLSQGTPAVSKATLYLTEDYAYTNSYQTLQVCNGSYDGRYTGYNGGNPTWQNTNGGNPTNCSNAQTPYMPLNTTTSPVRMGLDITSQANQAVRSSLPLALTLVNQSESSYVGLHFMDGWEAAGTLCTSAYDCYMKSGNNNADRSGNWPAITYTYSIPPLAPQSVTTSRPNGGSSVTLNWSAPAAPQSVYNGGAYNNSFPSRADNYTINLYPCGSATPVTGSPATFPETGGTDSYTFNGLNAGTCYDGTISSINFADTSPYSVPPTATASFQAPSYPSAPTVSSITASDSTISGTLSPSSSDGTDGRTPNPNPISKYRVYLYPAGQSFGSGTPVACEEISASAALNYRFDAATGSSDTSGCTSSTHYAPANGSAFQVQAVAYNGSPLSYGGQVAGFGAVSSASGVRQPPGTPFAPSTVVVTGGDTTATVSWIAPPTQSNGAPGDNGSAISKYVITLNSSDPDSMDPVTVEATSSPVTISDILNGLGYTASVSAVNAAGAGAVGTSSQVYLDTNSSRSPYDPLQSSIGSLSNLALGTVCQATGLLPAPLNGVVQECQGMGAAPAASTVVPSSFPAMCGLYGVHLTRYDRCETQYLYYYIDRCTDTCTEVGRVEYVLSDYDYLNRTKATWHHILYLSIIKVTSQYAQTTYIDGTAGCVSDPQLKACTVVSSSFPAGVVAQGKSYSADAVFQTQANQRYSLGEHNGYWNLKFTSIGSYISGGRNVYVNERVRCDTALPTTDATTGCVHDDFTPTLTYSTQGNLGDVAKHIRAAQADGLPSVLTRGDGGDYAANRAEACSSNTISLPNGLSCDEYPFASVREGAGASANKGFPRTFTSNPDCHLTFTKPVTTSNGKSYGYSMCGVAIGHNKSQGGSVGGRYGFYGRYRMLPGDQFNMATTTGPPDSQSL